VFDGSGGGEVWCILVMISKGGNYQVRIVEPGTKGNMNECKQNEIKHFVVERKLSYD
jgi:hypothetical protein